MYACQKATRRKFNPNNYRGKWTKQDELTLVEMVKLHGQKWTVVAQELNRTPENCRDKFREIGGEQYEIRKKGPWTLEEKLELISIINDKYDPKFMKKRVVLDYKNKDSIAHKKDLSEEERKLVSKGYKRCSKSVLLYKEFELKDIILSLIHI